MCMRIWDTPMPQKCSADNLMKPAPATPAPNERPPLNASLSASSFAAWYWLKSELQAFCRAEGLHTGGGKAELMQRVGRYLGAELAPLNAFADAHQAVFRDLPLQGACFGLRQIDGKDQFCCGRREAMVCDWHICFFTKKNIELVVYSLRKP